MVVRPLFCMLVFVAFVTVLFGANVVYLLGAAESSTLRRATNGTLKDSDDSWVPFDSEMAIGRAYSAVVWLNGSLVIIGGCRDVACTQRVNAVDIVDPSDQTEPQHMELPIKLGGRGLGSGAHGNATPLMVAGPTSAVRVDDIDDQNNSGVYVVGACSYYYPERDGFPQSPLVREQYASIWALSNDMTKVVDHFLTQSWVSDSRGAEAEERVGDSVPAGTVLRANATCASHGHLLFIVGGVDMNTGGVIGTVDVYDTQKRQYHPDIFNLTTAVRNPLVTLDNALMYVVGGEVHHDGPLEQWESELFRECSEGHKWVNATDNPGEVSSVGLWCPTPAVQVVMLVESDPLVNDDNSSKTSASLSLSLIPGVPCNMELSIPSPQKRHMFAFNGRLCVMMNSSFVNCLDIEKLFNHTNPNNGNDSSPDMWEPLIGGRSPLPTEISTPFAFPLSTGLLGATMVFFNIGGFDADGTASTRLFYRASDVAVTSVAEVRAVIPVGVPLNLTLRPPRSGFVRLSSNVRCTDNVAGTTDAQVFQQEDEATVAVFYPMGEATRVFVCFANGFVPLPCVDRGCPAAVEMSLLYTPVTFTPFRIHHEVTPQPQEGLNRKLLYTIGVFTTCLAGLIVVVVTTTVISRPVTAGGPDGDYTVHLLAKEERKTIGSRISPKRAGGRRQFVAEPDRSHRRKVAEAASGSAATPRNLRIAGDGANFRTEMDMVVKNTTRDSRYEVVRRIGEGAFSSVYLVKHRRSKQQFALKYLVCRDNKERLDALRECETINSLQGHPNIIRIVEMFMNYEFTGGNESPSTPQAFLAHAMTSPYVFQPKRGSCAFASKEINCSRLDAPLLDAGIPRAPAGPHGEKRNIPEVPASQKPLAEPQKVDITDPARSHTAKGTDEVSYMPPPSIGKRSKEDNLVSTAPPPSASAASVSTHCGSVRSSNHAQPPPDVHETSPPNAPTRLTTSSAVGAEGNSATVAVRTVGTPSQLTTPARQQAIVVHYPNFAQPTERMPSPIVQQQQQGENNDQCEQQQQEGESLTTSKRTSYAPRGGIHYKDFDIAISASGVARCPQPALPPTPTLPNYVQPAAGSVQYTNFVAEDLCACAPTHCSVPAMSKPKSVADAVRAARLQRNSSTKVLTAEIDTSSILGGHIGREGRVSSLQTVATYQPSLMGQQVQCSERGRNNVCSHSLGAVTNTNHRVDGTQTPRRQPYSMGNGVVILPTNDNVPPASLCHSPLKPVAEVRERSSQPSPDQGLAHSRYLGLVMEYHPLGDLCGYAMRHSATHNPKVRSQLEREKLQAACAYEEKLNKRDEDTSDGVRLISSNSQSPLLPPKVTAPRLFCGEDSCGSSPCGRAAAPDRRVGAASTSNCGSGMNDIYKKLEDMFVMRENPFTEPQLLSIAYQLSSVLHHLHSQRPPIVHRDLKPENILIRGNPLDCSGSSRHEHGGSKSHHGCNREGGSKEGKDVTSPLAVAVEVFDETPKERGKSPRSTSRGGCPTRITADIIPIVVTDFGLAFVLEGRRKMGRGGGTRPYIAPECWVGQTSTASDLWSLGCVLYALATARVTVQTVRLMYEEAEREGFAAMVMNDILARNYSLEFASFVLSLLVTDPDKRLTAKMAMHCFEVVGENFEATHVQFNPNSPFFSNVQEL
ncbi:protein kinase, putative [Trypanosoma brucei gambiense DAL972]|uniref:non-specific serine/threonine protein kinase n=1 Tax=Trypanosoma brucei gambiense (strain MHOM/CI/86/DAL972) TaxID=679716 RepID=C9ZPH2_TRYB9|nr:protein kinase, putative [Trypanosoma brucei gambiense DAL972]CBH11300.1 protein kinase, putative [Trypanosoma brucei gambiense DAL972]|eukprot:XP_011773587.1 protein kinase, putative [Trypanosoma brucei gambiense DAL972]